jgi:hypothetical protein
VVLEAGQTGQRSATARTGPVRSRGGHQLAHGPWAGALAGRDVEKAETLLGAVRAVGEELSEQLEAGADAEDHRTAIRGLEQCPVLAERGGGADLRTVLTAPDAVEIGGGDGTPRPRLDQLGVDAAPRCPARQDQAVPSVPIGAEQVGEDDGDGERRATGGRTHNCLLRSANAV